jgi:hypothetical protein
MYKIIGADQKEYGPVTEEEIRAWIAQGRANGQTLAQTENGPWKPLAAFPEFAPALSALAPPPPPLGGLTAASTAKQWVHGPGVFLIIVGALGSALHLARLLGHALGWAFAGLQSTGNPEVDDLMTFLSGGLGVALDILWLGLSVLIGFGGWRMVKLKNYGWCVAASVIALVPCLSPCCCYCLGLPAGIWALAVLSRPEVRIAFDSLAH